MAHGIMTARMKNKANKGMIGFLCLILFQFTGCNAPQGVFTIGVVDSTVGSQNNFEGFKYGMEDLGYTEGKNIRYIYDNIKDNPDKNVDVLIKEILAKDIDILLTIGDKACLSAAELTKVSDTPVVFCGDAWPVEKGLVKSLRHPGGNMTGVRVPDATLKAMELFASILPKAKKIYIPYNPDENVSVLEVEILEDAASQLGIELVLQKIHSLEEALQAIERLPEDIDGVFAVPSPTLNMKGRELSQAAISRRIPIGSPIIYDETFLITLTPDFFDAGRKAARLAQQIHQGVKPAELPVEVSEVEFIINLITAEKIGITIPDSLLIQADTIIR